MIIAIVVLVVIVGLLCVNTNKAEKKSEIGDTSGVLIVSSFSAFGGADVTTIYTDRTFKAENNLSFNPERVCVEGVVPDSDYSSFVSYLISTNFTEKKIKQKNESGLLCEGGTSLFVAIEGEENKIRPPCASENTQETTAVINLADEIRTKLKELINKSPQQSCAVPPTQ